VKEGFMDVDRKTPKKSFIRANWGLLVIIVILIAAMAVVLVIALK
jgi:hypothetical protein